MLLVHSTEKVSAMIHSYVDFCYNISYIIRIINEIIAIHIEDLAVYGM